MLGYYETHFTNAWPAAKDVPGIEARQCTEHGPTCAVKTTLISAPIKRVLVLEGATAEAMGSD